MATWSGWPPRSKLTCYHDKKPLLPRLDQGRLDLADTFMWGWSGSRTVELTLSTLSKKWDRWDEAALDEMEENIRYDLSEDGFCVAIKRVSGEGEPCSTEMRWELIIKVNYGPTSSE